MLFQRAGDRGEAAVSEVENEGRLLVQHRCSQKVPQPPEFLWAWGRALRPHGKSRGSGLTLRLVFTGQAGEKWMFYLKCYGNCREIMPVEGSSQSLFLFTRDKKRMQQNQKFCKFISFYFITARFMNWKRSLSNLTQFPSGIIRFNFFNTQTYCFFKISWDFSLCTTIVKPDTQLLG